LSVSDTGKLFATKVWLACTNFYCHNALSSVYHCYHCHCRHHRHPCHHSPLSLLSLSHSHQLEPNWGVSRPSGPGLFVLIWPRLALAGLLVLIWPRLAWSSSGLVMIGIFWPRPERNVTTFRESRAKKYRKMYCLWLPPYPTPHPTRVLHAALS
jgi:hypothetical protein